MTRLYLKLILPIAIIFLASLLTAHALGATQPPNPALRGFTEGCEDKPQPCWYGIVPGMGVENAQAIIESLGYVLKNEPSPGAPFDYESTQISPSCIELWYYEYVGYRMSTLMLGCVSLNMSEGISFFGTPDYISHNTLYGMSINYPSFSITIADAWFTPLTHVSRLTILSQNAVYSANGLQLKWQGFKPLSYYCQSQPEYVGCH